MDCSEENQSSGVSRDSYRLIPIHVSDPNHLISVGKSFQKSPSKNHHPKSPSKTVLAKMERKNGREGFHGAMDWSKLSWEISVIPHGNVKGKYRVPQKGLRFLKLFKLFSAGLFKNLMLGAYICISS